MIKQHKSMQASKTLIIIVMENQSQKSQCNKNPSHHKYN